MTEQKKALITGITGQDGSYLAELLLSKGYIVHGLVRRSSSIARERIDHLKKEDDDPSSKFFLHYGDLTDSGSLFRVINQIKPDEIYNLGAQSHVRISFDMPEYTMDVVGLGAVRLLDAIRHINPKIKFYQASSSEMFGKVKETPQKETTEFNPQSPYGIAKVFAHSATVNYREAYNIFGVSGILFNHESPRRGENFVTKKITNQVAEIVSGKRDKISLGNLDAKRDWGYAPDYVEAMWMMMQADKPDDYVIATGETHTIKDFISEAFRLAGINNWEKFVGVDPRYYRPTEVNYLLGDYSKAANVLGWQPKVRFKELVKIMLEDDCRRMGVELKKS